MTHKAKKCPDLGDCQFIIAITELMPKSLSIPPHLHIQLKCRQGSPVIPAGLAGENVTNWKLASNYLKNTDTVTRHS
ncbi:MAG TPA: hypothetical protein V6D26_19345 [Stenomitos sp.]